MRVSVVAAAVFGVAVLAGAPGARAFTVDNRPVNSGDAARFSDPDEQAGKLAKPDVTFGATDRSQSPSRSLYEGGDLPVNRALGHPESSHLYWENGGRSGGNRN